MFIFPSGSSSYKVQRSVRLRSAASAFLSRTPGVAGNRRTWTWSGWVKRGVLGSSRPYRMFSNNSSGDIALRFEHTSPVDSLTFYGFNGSTYDYQCVTSALFRDPSAWYHVVCSFDTTQAASSDRIKLYVNGVLQTLQTATYPALNSLGNINSTTLHGMGAAATTNTEHADGYLSEINFIDGQALTPSSFGETDATTGQWVPKKYSGTYGTNGFYLDFSDITSTTTIGYDKSGNGNNWTANNISLTAGATYDSMLDVPGLPWADGGNGRGNYCTLNPLIASAANISYANLRSGTTPVQATQDALAFNSQWEVTAGASNVTAGVISGTGTTNTTTVTANKTFSFRLSTAGALDCRNVTDAGAWTAITTGLSGQQFPYGTTAAADWNFGQRPFSDTLTATYKALHTGNLAAPTIRKPSDHFNIALDTGANIKTTTEALYPSNFLEWIKDRANANNHQLIDTVRGTSAVLQSNTTAAETTYSAPAGSSVGWAWKAGGGAVANTAGSITSQVSANTTAGFSIVTYTGTGVNSTVGHGLGVAPKMVIVKGRTGTLSWNVWHNALAGTEYLLLESTQAKATEATKWNSTIPSSTVFSLGTAPGTNTNTTPYVAYCFAEIPGYSKFGSYTGNGSADGPFVYCGFRPRYLLVKRTDVAGYGWAIQDAARNPYNLVNLNLYAELANAESGGGYTQDFTANGFKIRDAGPGQNANGGTYIFAAFAEYPFQYSTAR